MLTLLDNLLHTPYVAAVEASRAGDVNWVKPELGVAAAGSALANMNMGRLSACICAKEVESVARFLMDGWIVGDKTTGGVGDSMGVAVTISVSMAVGV